MSDHALARIVALTKAAECCLSNSDPNVRSVGADLMAWVEGGASISLDAQLGLRRQGGVSAKRALALADRDCMLRTLYAERWADLAPSAASRVMIISFERYECTRWLRERTLLSAPSAEPAATWWRMLRTGSEMPGSKRLSQILMREIQGMV